MAKSIQFLSANSILDEKKEVIPWSPQIDKGLSGGIQAGSTVVVGGPPKLGKTTSILHLCKNAQKMGYVVVYADIECRLHKRDLMGVTGLDLSEDKFKLIRSQKGLILEGEEYMEAIEQALKTGDKIIAVADSLSALCCKDLIDADIKDRYRDSSPLLISRFCKKVCNYIGVTNNVFIGVTHIIANQGMGHKTWVEASGNKIRYACDFKIRGTHISPWSVKINKEDVQIGQEIHWNCEYSALGSPNRSCTSKLRYGEGIDEYAEMIELAAELGVMKTKSGGWYFYEDNTWHGLEATIKAMKDLPEVFNKINNNVRSMLGWK